MLIVAIDTTTRAGSISVMRDGRVLSASEGDPQRTHAERLPGDLVSALEGHGFKLGDVDAFVVAAGPGSFTGLRIGIATIQGLAFALDRPVVGVSVLDALAVVAARADDTPAPRLVGAFMDAQRKEVFASLYRVSHEGEGASADTDALLPRLELLDGPVSEPPAVVLERWTALSNGNTVFLAGDGVQRYRDLIGEHLGSRGRAVEPARPLAATLAELGSHKLRAGHATSPHAVKPIYIRRPDAELARERTGKSESRGLD